MNWVIAGGGTGGHVTPALALGDAISKRGDRVLFIGSDQGLEARLVPKAGFEFKALSSRQVMGRGLLGRSAGILGILSAANGARHALGKFQPDLVISVGGYAAMPAILAAALARTPLFLVEPNALPGRVNRLGSRLAREVFVGFDSSRAFFPIPDIRIQCLGIPLRRELVDAFQMSAPRTQHEGSLHLGVFGGSQGARQINETMLAALPDLSQLPIEIFHQTGSADFARVQAAYSSSGVRAEVVEFESDMPRRYRWAHLVLCRAGALTLAELALAGLPALLVPYPFAADNHQDANARVMEAAGAAHVLRGLDLSGKDWEQVVNAIGNLSGDPSTLSRMSRAALDLSRPSAATDIVDSCAASMEMSA